MSGTESLRTHNCSKLHETLRPNRVLKADGPFPALSASVTQPGGKFHYTTLHHHPPSVLSQAASDSGTTPEGMVKGKR